MSPKLTSEQRKQLREDVRTTLLGELARKYGVSHQTILNYLREDFDNLRARLLTEGKTESEATLQAYEEVYKCKPIIKTLEI